MPPIMDSSDFTIRRKDFPALPGNVNTSDSSPESSWSEDDFSSNEATTVESDTPRGTDPPEGREINISADGRVSNIPPSMINDQYGMVGLLTFIRASEARPSLGSLTLGEDLSSLGLNLKLSKNLYTTFEGPWTGVADIDCPHLPYELTPNVRQQLAKVFLSKHEDDLLFYLFYTRPREMLQLVAASELYRRGWRYNTKQKLWMCPLPGGANLEEPKTFCLSTFYVFDVKSWKKVMKECFLVCGQLEGQPVVPKISHHL